MNITKERYFENDFVEIWFEDGIIYQIFKPNTHLNIEAAKKVVADRMIISQKATTPIFVDVRNLVYADIKAHQFMASRDAVEYISAGAFIVSGMLSRVLMNLFLAVYKPVVPAMSFTDKDKAVKWLQKFKFLN